MFGLCVFVDETMEISSLAGSLATLLGSGVIVTVTSVDWPLGVGGSTTVLVLGVGANDNFICCGPVDPILLSLSTLICLDLRPPLGEASFPAVLVGFCLPFGRLVMVAHVASGTLKDVAARAGHCRLSRSS